MRCAPTISAPVFLGRDNLVRLVLSHDGAVLSDLSALTRVVVDFGDGVTVDSDTVGLSVIWWTDTTLHRGETVNVLTLQLGGQAIAAGTYDDVTIVVYDSTYTNGLQLENPIRITVHA